MRHRVPRLRGNCRILASLYSSSPPDTPDPGCQLGCSSLGTFGAETTTVQRRFMIHFGGFHEQRPRACLRIGNAKRDWVSFDVLSGAYSS